VERLHDLGKPLLLVLRAGLRAKLADGCDGLRLAMREGRAAPLLPVHLETWQAEQVATKTLELDYVEDPNAGLVIFQKRTDFLGWRRGKSH